MTPDPGRSRYLRKGYLTPAEQVRYETRASRWYFFFGPACSVVFAGVGAYLFAVAVSSRVPSLGALSSFLRSQGPSRVALAWLLLLAYGLIAWLAGRRRLLLHHGRASPARPGPVAPEPSPHLLFVPTLALIPTLLAIYAFAVYAFSQVPAAPGVMGVLDRTGPVRLGALLFSAVLGALVLWSAVRWAQWAQDSYAVTNDRLIKQHARWTWLGRIYDDREIQVRQVRDLDVYQSRLWWRVFGIGTLNIHSLSDIPAMTRSGAYAGPDPTRVNPYVNPQLPIEWAPLKGSTDASPGVEWWFAIPDPLRAQREIQQATEGTPTNVTNAR